MDGCKSEGGSLIVLWLDVTETDQQIWLQIIVLDLFSYAFILLLWKPFEYVDKKDWGYST